MGMHIERVAASLNAMDSDQVSEPTLPISRALLEAAELAGLVQKEAVRSKLTNVGLELVTMTALPLAIAALREAEAEWTVARDAGKPNVQKDREDAGKALRQRLLRSCRFNLRRDLARPRPASCLIAPSTRPTPRDTPVRSLCRSDSSRCTRG
jgi:hypothetical protein